MSRADAERWGRGLDTVMERIGARFGRVEPRRRALAYVRGLRSPVARKNGWQLAEVAGDRTPDGVQDFLSRVHWEADLVRDDPGLRRGRICARMRSSTWAMSRRCWCWTRPAS